MSLDFYDRHNDYVLGFQEGKTSMKFQILKLIQSIQQDNINLLNKFSKDLDYLEEKIKKL